MIQFWIKFFFVKLLEFLFIVIAVPMTPIAFFMKHVCEVNIPPFRWMLNDTEDGDYGAEWWLKDKALKPGLWSAFLWWLRNPVWNFKLLFRTPETGEIVRIVNNDIGHPLMWVRQDLRGVNHVYYKANGKIWGRYSKSNNWINLYFGVQSRYILKIRRSK